MDETIDIVFTAPPGPASECVFVPHTVVPVAGALIITWPKAGPAGLYPALVKLTNAETGEQLVTVTRMVIDADCNASGLIMAELTMLCDADGNPLRSDQTPQFDEHGKLPTAVFRWVVAEMRVAS